MTLKRTIFHLYSLISKDLHFVLLLASIYRRKSEAQSHILQLSIHLACGDGGVAQSQKRLKIAKNHKKLMDFLLLKNVGNPLFCCKNTRKLDKAVKIGPLFVWGNRSTLKMRAHPTSYRHGNRLGYLYTMEGTGGKARNHRHFLNFVISSFLAFSEYSANINSTWKIICRPTCTNFNSCSL